MTTHLLDPGRLREGPRLALFAGAPPDLSLRQGRVHEVCGPARRTFAVLAMAQTAGAVLWILPAWLPERPMPAGMQRFADPGRLLLATARRPEDVLWAMEEGLRAGVVGLVVAEVAGLPTLTQMRRLQLATEAGGGQALGLVLTPGDGGAAGAETRWHMAQAPGGGWHLARPRARAAMPMAWTLAQGPQGAIRLAGAGGAPG